MGVQETGKSQIAIFEELAGELTPKQRETEEAIRVKLIQAVGSFKISRYELGKALSAYKVLCKELKRENGGDHWFDRVLNAVGIERATGYRIVASYRQVLKVPQAVRIEAENRRIDLAETKHARLVSQIQERSGQDHADHNLPASDLLDKCLKAVELHKSTAAPTVEKATGPIPIPALTSGKVNYAARKAELIQVYRKAYKTQAEADSVIDAVIVAALEAQLGKLPKVAA